MTNYILTPNMSLPAPIVGVDPGPEYAYDQNTGLGLIDTHDHSAGKGVLVTPAGLSINSDLSFQSNNATVLRSSRYAAQTAPLSGAADLGCLYVSGVDLYYNDELGNQVRITQSGGVAGTSGSIAGLVPPASATYVALSETFVWQSAANTSANLDAGSIVIRQVLANANGVTISSPTSLASSYQLTLPSALPGSTSFLTIAANGDLGVASSVSATQIANGSLTYAQIAGGFKAPTVQAFTAGESGTYTTPSSPAPLYLRVRAYGSGGGGAGSTGIGQTGGTTTFGSLISCTGGVGGNSVSLGQGGVGGTATVSAPAIQVAAITGSAGNNSGAVTGSGSGAPLSSFFFPGGNGGTSPLGGAGAGGYPGGGASATSSGSGGGGNGMSGSNSAANRPGGGGGAGGYAEAIITSPSATYAYQAGTAAGGGTGTDPGGNSGGGYIVVEEHYQ